MKYRFLDELTVAPYNGEPLRVFEGQDCIKYVANPTDEQLAEFDYKDLDDTAEIPETQEGYRIERYYIDGDIISAAYRQVEIIEVSSDEEEFLPPDEMPEIPDDIVSDESFDENQDIME